MCGLGDIMKNYTITWSAEDVQVQAERCHDKELTLEESEQILANIWKAFKDIQTEDGNDVLGILIENHIETE